MSQPENNSLLLTEALLEVYEGVTSGRLGTYGALKSFIGGLCGNINKVSLLERGVRLQRQLYWGFFHELSPAAYPKIWSQLVVADRSYPQFGELKRFAAIHDIYLALIDIHGYTQFCRDARHNTSRVDLLDRMIQEDISLLCTKFGVLNRRVRGDEILVLGAAALDVLHAIDAIIQYFSKRKRIAGAEKDASHSLELPEFCLSAGIAGGKKYASLVVTREGDLSGDIVNTAARLQARANKISPDRNRILITNQVYQDLNALNPSVKKEMSQRFSFFNVGDIDFKGVSVMVYDLVFLPAQAWRMGYHPIMEELLAALKKKRWRKEIFDLALSLASRLSLACPVFDSHQTVRNQLTELTKRVHNFWINGFYESAVKGLLEIIEILKTVPQTDDVVIEYLGLVYSHYETLKEHFSQAIEKQIDTSPPFHLRPEERKVFLTLQKHAEMYQVSKDSLRLKHTERQEFWNRSCELMAEGLSISLKAPK